MFKLPHILIGIWKYKLVHIQYGTRAILPDIPAITVYNSGNIRKPYIFRFICHDGMLYIIIKCRFSLSCHNNIKVIILFQSPDRAVGNLRSPCNNSDTRHNLLNITRNSLNIIYIPQITRKADHFRLFPINSGKYVFTLIINRIFNSLNILPIFPCIGFQGAYCQITVNKPGINPN